MCSDIMLTTHEELKFFQLAQLKARLKLEIFGMKSGKGRTAYSLAKQLYGLKGSKIDVLVKLEKMVEEGLNG